MYTRECEPRFKSCEVTTTGRFILTREARTPVRTHACTHMSQRPQKEQGNVGGDARLQGRRPSTRLLECEYYGTEAITEDFLFALRLSSFFHIFRIIIERKEEEKEEGNP